MKAIEFDIKVHSEQVVSADSESEFELKIKAIEADLRPGQQLVVVKKTIGIVSIIETT